MPPPVAVICGNCVYWFAVDGSGDSRGFCRFEAPSPVIEFHPTRPSEPKANTLLPVIDSSTPGCSHWSKKV